MIVFGYAKQYQYTNDGTLMIQVRVPAIHGAFDRTAYRGKAIRNYVDDADLPYYQSILLPHLPTDGEVVALSAVNTAQNEFIVIGLTGGSYYSGVTNL
jgi:hypothetical protein